MSEAVVEKLRIVAVGFQRQWGVNLDGVVAQVKSIDATDENLKAALLASTRAIDALKIANKLRQNSQLAAKVALESIYKWLLLVEKAVRQRKSEVELIKSQVGQLSSQMDTLVSEASPENSPRSSVVASDNEALDKAVSLISDSLDESEPEEPNALVRLLRWLYAQVSKLFSYEQADDSHSIADPVVEDQQQEQQKKQQYQFMFRRNENIVTDYFKKAQEGELPAKRAGIAQPQWVTAGGDAQKQ